MRGLRAAALTFLFAATLAPLIVWTGFSWPYIEPKALWFRACVGLAFTCWLVLCFGAVQWRPRANPVLLALGGVLAVMLLADLRAPIPLLSFFGRTERMDGYFGLAYFFAFVLTATALLDTEGWRRRFVAFALAVSVGVGLVGLWQFAQFVVQGRAFAQVTATLGNPVYLGQYAVLMFCLACWLAVRATRAGRVLLLAPLALNLLTLYLCQGRGAALALLAAGFVAALSLRRWRAPILLGTAVAFVLLVGLPFLHLGPLRFRQWTTIDFTDLRVTIWQMALATFAQRPWLGWGHEGMMVAGGWAVHVDRAHNLFLDWLVAGGVAGLLAWLSALGATAWRAWSAMEGGERTALWCFLTAYLVTDMVLFDTLTSFMALGTVMVLVGAAKPLTQLAGEREWLAWQRGRAVEGAT